MPNLRELLQQHRVEETVSITRFCTWTYNLLEAIVEELEAQRPPQVDARIVALTADRDSWERQCRNAERGLAEAKAEIERWRKESNLEMAARMMGEPLSPGLEARFEELKADARIGELVRGMAFGTELRRTYASLDGTPVWMAMQLVKGCWEFVAMSCKDPADALRLIQGEVGDA